MRTDKELLEYFLEHFEKSIYRGFCVALCGLFCNINKNITLGEFERLDKILRNNKPSETQHTEFTKINSWTNGGDYWWDKSDKQTRIKFIKKLIEQS